MSKKHKRNNYVQMKPSPPQPVSGGKTLRLNLWVFIFLAVTVFVLYANSLHCPFIWDDQYLIQDNHFIKSLKYIPEIFKYQLYYSTAGSSNFYRPLQSLVLMFDFALWKMNPVGYHLTSIIFHLLCAFTIYLIIQFIFKKKVIAFFVSLLFLVHPANSTVVDYISSRADSQVTLFILVSYLLFFASFYHKDTTWRKKIYYLFSLLSFILGLLSKELGIILPLLILTTWPIIYRKIDPEKKPRYKNLIPFFVILGAYVVLRITVLNFSSPSKENFSSLYIRLLTTAESFLRLIGILFVPREIHIEKSIPFSHGILQASTMFSVLAFVVLSVFIYKIRKNHPMSFFGMVWFFTALLPMANIKPINATIADHWLYLSCLGLFLAVIAGASDLIDKFSEKQIFLKRFAAVVCVVAVIIFSLLTINQNTIWKDPLKFYQLAIKYSPKSFRAHNEIGVIYLDKNKYDLAIEEFKSAIAINPAFDQAYDNLGVAYDKSDNLEESLIQHKKAVELNPYNAKTYNNLGNAYNRLARFDEAIKAYENALRLNPDYKAVYNNLGVIYYKKGMYDQAEEYWKRALLIDPGFQTAIDNLRAIPPHSRP